MAGDDVFLGQILTTPFNFAPNGFAFCQGQLLPITQHTALFTLLGTIYGGNGTTTFALPDMRGRVPMHFGQGPGLSSHDQGETSGDESVALFASEMPPHTHTVTATLTGTARARNAFGNQATPVNAVPATDSASMAPTYSLAAPDAAMRAGSAIVGGSAAATLSGGGAAHNNLQPYLTINYVIALVGVYPPRP